MKKCGNRGSKQVYFKEELVRMAVERLGLSPSVANKKTKTELCRLLGIEELSVKVKTPIHKEKVCSAKKTKTYPNRYTKEELIERIFTRKNNRISRSVLQKLKIAQLCRLANLDFVEIQPSGKIRAPKPPKQDRLVLPPGHGAEEGIEETKEGADCVTRGRKRPFQHQLKVIEHFKKHRGLIAVHSLGSGKTLTAVLSSQCYLDEHPTHRVVVVAPTTLIGNFKKEMLQFGDLRHVDRYQFYSFQGFCNRFKKNPPRCQNTFLIVDEAHNLRTQYRKTPKKEVGLFNKVVTQCAEKANQVLLLTATPIINRPGDLAALLNMVRDPKTEDAILAKDVNKEAESAHLGDYLRRVASCKVSFYNVDKETQEQHYPRVNQQAVYLPMPRAFLEAYNKVQNLIMEDEVVMGTFGESELKPFFNGIRRAVNILAELPEDELVNSPKVKWILQNLRANPHKKTVIFSHFLDMGLKAIQKRLPANIRSDYITGSQSKTKRNEIVQKYNNDEIDVLFISKAGGEGIDLKGTRQIILMESGWNENSEKQVIGRGCRFGSHSQLPREEREVDVFQLYHIKPSELRSVLNQLSSSDKNDPKKVEKKMKEMLEEYNHLDSTEEPDLWLSADLMLRKISLEKQKKIDKFLRELRKLKIESSSC